MTDYIDDPRFTGVTYKQFMNIVDRHWSDGVVKTHPRTGELIVQTGVVRDGDDVIKLPDEEL